jgi:hypothetical protein
MRLISDLEVHDKVFAQLEEYKKSIGYFGTVAAIRQRDKLNPGNNIIVSSQNFVAANFCHIFPLLLSLVSPC